MKNSGILQNLYLKGFSKTYLVMVKRKTLVKIPVKFVGRDISLYTELSRDFEILRLISNDYYIHSRNDESSRLHHLRKLVIHHDS